MNPNTSTATYLKFFLAMGPELEPRHFLSAAESLFDADARKVRTIDQQHVHTHTDGNVRVIHVSCSYKENRALY